MSVGNIFLPKHVRLRHNYEKPRFSRYNIQTNRRSRVFLIRSCSKFARPFNICECVPFWIGKKRVLTKHEDLLYLVVWNFPLCDTAQHLQGSFFWGLVNTKKSTKTCIFTIYVLGKEGPRSLPPSFDPAHSFFLLFFLEKTQKLETQKIGKTNTIPYSLYEI